MANLELYINQQLCETESSDSFSVYLKRQLFNPAELSTKDAQRSYDITLPATAVNNQIFGYINTEEVKGKFSRLYDAQLIVNGVKIFDGKFKMSEISKTYYKGNLGIPAQKTVKDIFGDKMMNEAGEWKIPFKGIEDITNYNIGRYDDFGKYGNISPCIFPLVLYGLLPKRSDANNNFTSKNVYDNSVSLKLKDLFPSVNVIHMLSEIFSKAKYTLTGSALNDERLKNLYVSYKNPSDYVTEWNTQTIEIAGKWGKYKNGHQEERVSINEFEVETNGEYLAQWKSININLFKADNKDINYDLTSSDIKNTDDGILLKVPYSGLYKLVFNADIQIVDEIAAAWSVPNLEGTNFELKVVRYSDDDNLSKERLDNSFFRDNQNQSYRLPGDNDIFPKEGEVNFVDPKQNANLLCGLAWGERGDNMFVNPMAKNRFNPMAIKHGNSWDHKNSFRAYSAVNSPGYINRSGSSENKFIIELINAPQTKITKKGSKSGSGQISQIIWLEKGDTISVISSSYYERSNNYWYNHDVEFKLSLEPYINSKGWLNEKIDEEGNSNVPINWDDTPTFLSDHIDLMRFLPSNIKINDWIENFCKTFNLSLINKENGIFELNLKNIDIIKDANNLINIDEQTNVIHRKNEPLRLPFFYELGFTTNMSEEGYYSSMKKNENGDIILNTGLSNSFKYYTGSNETNVVTHMSTFSYCWYKDLYDYKGDLFATIPVITDHEIWDNNYDYENMMDKNYYDKSQRFWYKEDIFDIVVNDIADVKIASVSNEYKGMCNLSLNYEDRPDSITRSFFFLMTNSDNNYTVVDCYLTPLEYANINECLVKFNGDLYNVAEVDGYDPLGRKQCRLKLIRKMY